MFVNKNVVGEPTCPYLRLPLTNNSNSDEIHEIVKKKGSQIALNFMK